MDRHQLETLVAEGESSTLEFKTSTAALSKVFRTVCAFLNSKGGIALIGVADNKRILGQLVTDGTRRDIARELTKIEPLANIEVQYISIEGNKQVIVIKANQGEYAPYTYEGCPYWRAESSTHKMPQQYYDQRVAQRFQFNFSWEDLTAESYSVADLDHKRILEIVQQGIASKRMPEAVLSQEPIKILTALKLMEGTGLKNAAIALFAKEPFPTYPQCQIKLARFKGIDRHEFLDSDQLYGNVFDLLERTMLFVQRHLPVAARIEEGKMQRVETPLIPHDAIREALLNALCHRDYSIRGGSIALAIYDDRMELSNHGGLLPNLTLEQIKTGFSEPRNPLIAEVFYRCRMIEKWGRGVPEIIKSCKEANDPEPEFSNGKAEFKVTFKFPTSLKPSVVVLKEQKDRLTYLTKRQREIIEILTAYEELKMKEILAELKEPPAERTLRDDLAVLRKLGFIGSQGHARSAFWFLIKGH